jgi:tRNA pseudouridine38-40 synthase
LSAVWATPTEHVLELWIEGETFMRHMVRTLVGTMLGGGNDAEALRRLLTGRPRSEAGETAPACGLYLESIRY